MMTTKLNQQEKNQKSPDARNGKEHDNSGQMAVRQPASQLSPAAKRALAEAEERRRQTCDKVQAKEVGGRGGSDPTRYGDWEMKGRAIDF